MRYFAYFAALILPLTACAPVPLTDKETFDGVAQSHVARTCFQRGDIRDQAAVAAYLSTVDTALRNRATAGQIQTASQAVAKAGPVQSHHCRQIELLAIQTVQAEAAAAAQQQQVNASLAQMNAQIQAQNNSRPKTTYCQHYQWGNMTTCNSY